MAAVTTAVVAGLGVGLSLYGQQQQKKAYEAAANANAADAEENARLAREKAQEDARIFRLSFRRDQERNKAQIGASGVKVEGSPAEVLHDNAAMAERDYQNILRFGEQQRSSYLRQAGMHRTTGRMQMRAMNVQSAATLLQGANQVYDTGSRSGAW